jgi:hypothetical protein
MGLMSGRISCTQAPPITAQVRFAYCVRKRRGQRRPPSVTITVRYSTSGLEKPETFLLLYMSVPVPYHIFQNLNIYFIWKIHGSHARLISVNNNREYSSCTVLPLVQLCPRRLAGSYFYGMFYAPAKIVGCFKRCRFKLLRLEHPILLRLIDTVLVRADKGSHDTFITAPLDIASCLLLEGLAH